MELLEPVSSPVIVYDLYCVTLYVYLLGHLFPTSMDHSYFEIEIYKILLALNTRFLDFGFHLY